MLNPLYLIGFEFYRGFPAEHRNQHLNLSALLVNLAHLAIEVLEWSVYDDDRIALREVYRVAHDIARSALEDLLYLLRRKRHGLVGGADEAGNLRRVAHHAPRVGGSDHGHQNIAGKHLLPRFLFPSVL